MIRRGLAEMIIQHLGLKEVDYMEKHTGERTSAELISPPAKEPEIPPEPEINEESQNKEETTPA